MLKTVLKILPNFTLCWLVAALTTNTQMYIIGQVRYHYKTVDRWIDYFNNDWMDEWMMWLVAYLIFTVCYFFVGATLRYFLKSRWHALLLSLILTNVVFVVFYLRYTYYSLSETFVGYFYFLISSGIGLIIISQLQNIKNIIPKANKYLEKKF